MKIKSYYNDAIIGNSNMVVSFSKKGELLRLNYPSIDYKQFVDFFYTGIKVNSSNIIYLHDDINNKYNQYYTENTNILNTEIENTYFNLQIKQTDFVSVNKNLLVKKYEFKNNHNIDLTVNFLAYSKLLSNENNMVSSKIEDNVMSQYTHDYTMRIFSNKEILSYQLNDVDQNIQKGVVEDKDYIGMSAGSCVSYDLKTIKPGEKVEFSLFIYIQKNEEDAKDSELIKLKKINVKSEYQSTKKYWEKYVQEHNRSFNKKTKNIEQIKKIYTRTILLFPLLLNKKTGGISAALEIDENMTKCGRYSYCWPRDAVFMTKAIDLLKMEKEAERFYKVFCKKTQSENGMWEQRFYTDGRLAPCWGYQIDETASVVFGVYEHYKYSKNISFLKSSLKMCEKAVNYLQNYIDDIFTNKQIQASYDLWEMNEGIHLYSLSSIYAAFESMKNIYKEIKKSYKVEIAEKINDLETYKKKVKKYIDLNLYTDRALTRNTKDKLVDISTVGTVVPFKVFKPKEKIVENMIEKINMSLRTYTGGYLRFESDHYIGGQNPWVISNLWMAMYYIAAGKRKNAEECFEFVLNTANEHGFLAEQVDNDTMEPIWVMGLGWTHAMFIIAVNELM